MTNWKDTTERYIAFIDIMGFSNYVYRNSHITVKKRMLNLQEVLDQTESEINKLPKKGESQIVENQIKTVIFSDSILIITNDNSEKSLSLILFSCQLLLSKSYKRKIPMKGAISYGTITADFDKSLFFGKALIDSYQLQEQLFIYGIALDEKIEKRLFERKDLQAAYCMKGKTPTKSGSINHFTINWMKWLRFQSSDYGKINDIEMAKSTFEKFYHDMSGYPRKYLDNTIEYISEACT